MLTEFARYERLTHRVGGAPERLAAHLAGDSWPRVEGFLAERGGSPVGYALYFGMFSSFACAPVLWLEDLYVRESDRGLGAGRALMTAVAAVALARGCPRLAWAVLDWNEPALDFYRGLGAVAEEGWGVYALEGDPLRALGSRERNEPGQGAG